MKNSAQREETVAEEEEGGLIARWGWNCYRLAKIMIVT